MQRPGSVLLRMILVVGVALLLWAAGSVLTPISVQAWSTSDTGSTSSAYNLGPVGQYYTQVSPFLRSTLFVYNPHAAPATYRLTVRNDVGTPVATLQGQVDPGQTASHTPAEWGLHGLFHGELETSSDTPLAVYVRTESGEEGVDLWSEYVGVQESLLGQRYEIPSIPVRTEDGWDAELVLQNTDGVPHTAAVSLCQGAQCVSVGEVHLDGWGRRVVPLARLAFQDGGAGVRPASGVYAVRVQAETPVALLVHRFRRGAGVRSRLQAPEILWQRAFTAMDAAQAGQVSDREITESTYSQALYLPLVHNLVDLTRRAPLQPEYVPTGVRWYLPFLAAPNLPFRRNGPHPYAIGYPHQGIAETGRPLDAWPAFADFNWYNWVGGWYSRGESGDFCDRDPDFIPMVWSGKGRNVVPSRCTGRPLLLGNEPVDYRRVTGTYQHWTDTYFAHLVYLHRDWPGELYCCGYLERPGSPYEKITEEDSDYATLGNVMARYWERYGEPLPIDGIHMHVYVEGYNVDVANGRLPEWVQAYLAARIARWQAFVDERLGPDTPFLISEYGALTGGLNVAENRQVVLAALCDITRVVREGYGDRLVQMFYFDFYWGGERDPWRPMWMVGSEDGRYGIEEVNEVGQAFLEFVQSWPGYPARCGG